jgi:hypothetical protein
MSQGTKTESEDRGERDLLTELLLAGAQKLLAPTHDPNHLPVCPRPPLEHISRIGWDNGPLYG